jgi:hypothetical protein
VAGTSATRPPNVLLITTDEQRYDALGVTGNRRLRQRRRRR